jgi:serine-type D-Ala-D-Ala carboxypeptidase (penicillin-binding protein 5/6)
LIDGNYRTVLAKKNDQEPIYPASTTKVMTALTVQTLFHIDVDELLQSTSLAIQSTTKTKREQYPHMLEQSASHIGLKNGELLSFKHIMEGMLISSGCDASNVIGLLDENGLDGFIDKMNKLSNKIGCKHTWFKNTHGLHHDQQVSSVYDLSLIAIHALRDPLISDIVSKKYFHRPQTNIQSKATFRSTNLLVSPSSDYFYENAIGLKTGYTDEAGAVLIGAARYNDRLLIAVVAGTKSAESAAMDVKTLFDFGFSEVFRSVTHIKRDDSRLIRYTPYFWQNNIKGELESDLETSVYASNEENTQVAIKWFEVELPVVKKQHIGNAYILNTQQDQVKLMHIYAAEETKSSQLGFVLFIFFVIILAFFLNGLKPTRRIPKVTMYDTY